MSFLGTSTLPPSPSSLLRIRFVINRRALGLCHLMFSLFLTVAALCLVRMFTRFRCSAKRIPDVEDEADFADCMYAEGKHGFIFLQ